jgi:hypothetical protein
MYYNNMYTQTLTEIYSLFMLDKILNDRKLLQFYKKKYSENIHMVKCVYQGQCNKMFTLFIAEHTALCHVSMKYINFIIIFIILTCDKQKCNKLPYSGIRGTPEFLKTLES